MNPVAKANDCRNHISRKFETVYTLNYCHFLFCVLFHTLTWFYSGLATKSVKARLLLDQLCTLRGEVGLQIQPDHHQLSCSGQILFPAVMLSKSSETKLISFIRQHSWHAGRNSQELFHVTGGSFVFSVLCDKRWDLPISLSDQLLQMERLYVQTPQGVTRYEPCLIEATL